MDIFDNRINKYEEIIKDNEIVLFEFGQDNCMPCKAIKEKLSKFQEDNEFVKMYYIDVKNNIKLCAKNNIYASPAVLLYYKQKLVIRKLGYFSLDEVFDKIQEYKSLQIL